MYKPSDEEEKKDADRESKTVADTIFSVIERMEEKKDDE